MTATAEVRLDKWLWAARFFKTRTAAVEAIAAGRVTVNGDRAKASRSVRPGDRLAIRRPPFEHAIVVRAVSDRRGPATLAQSLYEEPAESRERREALAAEMRTLPPPVFKGRPTKKDRRSYEDYLRWLREEE